MSGNQENIVTAICNSAKYAPIAPEVVRDAVAWAAVRHKKSADIEKAARRRLHGAISAFNDIDAVSVNRYLSAYLNGDNCALNALLHQHASTRERMAYEEEICRAILDLGGENAVYFDIACGLFPIMLGKYGAHVIGWDAHKTAVTCINDWGAACGYHIEACWRDALTVEVFPESDCAILMKVLPLIDAQEHGGGRRLLNRVTAKKCVVSFPTRTLSGRNVGMYRYYEQWMTDNLPGSYMVVDRFELGSEAFWLMTRS